jgi:c(7)-type cytochrome triheme protein
MSQWQKLFVGCYWAGRRFSTTLLPLCVFVLTVPVFAQSILDRETSNADMPAEPSGEQSGATHLSGNTAADSVPESDDSTAFVGDMYQIGLGWHPAALEGLPVDKFGLVDWVAALEQELIEPRGGIEPGAAEAVPFDMNIVMPSKTGMIAGAYFPHKTHTTWMSCNSCHIKIFMPLAGSNDLTMSTIVKGQACGVCHGKVAFPLNDCARCHISNAGADDVGADGH